VHAPALWWFELRNALVVGERRGRVTSDMTHVFLGRLARMDIVIDRSADEVVVLDLARAHRLTVYDAACLGLALRGKSALATLDSALAKAARRAGVALVEAPA
jgi:predicted nucleic acid-binding protein